MRHRKTNLICECCGQNIYSDEGFLPGKHPRHMESCTCKLKPHQVKRYKPSEDMPKQTFLIPDRQRGYRINK